MPKPLPENTCPIQIISIAPGGKLYYDRLPFDEPAEHCWIDMKEEDWPLALDTALMQVTPYVCDIGKLGVEWAESADVVKIKFEHSEDVFSAIISISMTVEAQPRQGFTLRKLASDILEQEAGLLTVLTEIIELSERYIRGERRPKLLTQLNLLDDSDDDEEELDWDEE